MPSRRRKNRSALVTTAIALLSFAARGSRASDIRTDRTVCLTQACRGVGIFLRFKSVERRVETVAEAERACCLSRSFTTACLRKSAEQ